MGKKISAIIFWGALWGLEEASLGHLLHITTLNIGWFLWFPLAYFFMYMVYKQTGKLNSILFTSVIAAAIKLVDLFMTTNLIIIICPALSILLEGISLFAVLKLIDWKKHLCKHKLFDAIVISVLWRALYTVSILAIPIWIIPSYPYRTISLLLKFILFEGLLNSLFIYGIIILGKKVNVKHNTYFRQITEKITESKLMKEICFKPVTSLSLLAVAFIIQWVS